MQHPSLIINGRANCTQENKGETTSTSSNQNI